MSGGALLYPAAGTGLLALVLYDVFTTILHHWGGAGPLSGRLAFRVWQGAVALTRGIGPERRRRILGRVGPLLIPLTVTLWAGMVIVGFALLYFPWAPGAFHTGRGVPALRTFADAVYYSGVTFFTVGFGDVVPVTPGLRLMAMVEGGSGFALVTLVVGYFTSVYGVYSQQKVAAASLYYQAGSSPDAARVIRSYLHAGSAEGLAAEVGRLRDGLAAIRSGYASYPILHYFASSRPEQSLVRLLFVVQDLGTLLDTAVDERGCPVAAGLGSRSGMRAAAAAVQDGVAGILLRGGTGDARGRGPLPESGEAWARRFERARAELRGAGVPVREGGEALDEYRRRRGEWEPGLRAAAHALGEDWEEVAGGF
ncbi:MAG: potassium channel family protein [Gemmatimonadota bacterium]